MKHWIDALFILVTIVSFFRGYRAGFTTTIFSFVGFIGGGLLGLVIGLRYFESHGVTKFLLLFLAVTIGSSIGEAILNRIGKLFHSKFLFGPFKWVDSLLGAAFSILRAVIGLLIFGHLLLITPWGWAQRNIPQSEIYTTLNAHAPAIISDLTKRAETAIR
jgi:hypothetical protein